MQTLLRFAFAGVIGEAEKEGRGEEVRARVEKFKRDSAIKAYGVIAVFATAVIVIKLMYENDPTMFAK